MNRNKTDIKKYFDSYLNLLRELIRNQCVNTGDPDSGGEERSVKTLIRFFKEYNLEGEVFTPHSGRSNLLVTVPGTDPEAPSLMFMGHLDVVPAAPEEWSHDPFEADLEDDKLWGRGCLDMLGQTAAMAVTLAFHYASGKAFSGDFKFLAVADEEAAGTWGARYLVEHHWDKVKSDYMITELGGFYLDLPGPPRAVFTIGEKGVTQLKLSASGQASHGSLPFGIDNAAVKLAKGMSLIGENPPAPESGKLFRDMIGNLNLPEELELLFSRNETIDEGLALLSKDSPGAARLLHAFSRMTVSPNVISAGSKVNIIAGRGFMELDIRTLPGQTDDNWKRYLTDTLGILEPEYTFTEQESFASTASVMESLLMDACRRTLFEEDPEVKLVPLLTSVATDGRFWRERGTVVYGFFMYGRNMTMDRMFSMVHGRDESVQIESLRLGLNFYMRLVSIFFSEL